ncbi:MAG: carbonic anhydrase [Psychromonas sp.]|jgi:carbonic anhydrase|uniref:carbonic anhydrase n=1 Tax=Psychromonas sp. TaxID=1884585 RepID=UPI0039E22446
MSATDQLIAGYQRFREGYYELHKNQLQKLAEHGQSPKIAIVSCSDSRVDPTIILDCAPGDLFVIRNVANLVPPLETCDSFHGTSAALEFAVNELQVESIIVLGHTHCGGIKALMDTEPTAIPQTFISKWMKQLENVRKEILENDNCTSKEQHYHLCEQKGIVQSLDNLMTFPCIQKRVAAGNLKLHGWCYDLNSAELFAKQQDSDEFQKIS